MWSVGFLHFTLQNEWKCVKYFFIAAFVWFIRFFWYPYCYGSWHFMSYDICHKMAFYVHYFIAFTFLPADPCPINRLITGSSDISFFMGYNLINVAPFSLAWSVWFWTIDEASKYLFSFWPRGRTVWLCHNTILL